MLKPHDSIFIRVDTIPERDGQRIRGVFTQCAI